MKGRIYLWEVFGALRGCLYIQKILFKRFFFFLSIQFIEVIKEKLTLRL